MYINLMWIELYFNNINNKFGVNFNYLNSLFF